MFCLCDIRWKQIKNNIGKEDIVSTYPCTPYSNNERHICQYRQYNWQKIPTPNIKEYTSWKNVAKSK